jgi:hypothetical protein
MERIASPQEIPNYTPLGCAREMQEKRSVDCPSPVMLLPDPRDAQLGNLLIKVAIVFTTDIRKPA